MCRNFLFGVLQDHNLIAHQSARNDITANLFCFVFMLLHNFIFVQMRVHNRLLSDQTWKCVCAWCFVSPIWFFDFVMTANSLLCPAAICCSSAVAYPGDSPAMQ